MSIDDITTISPSNYVITENPFLETQEKFKEKSFCIVGNEIKVKMKNLGLDENDIAEISFENENHEYLELIDVYFKQVQELRNILEQKYIYEYSKYKEDIDGNEIQKMIDDETKENLLAKLSYHKSLKKLFKNYDGKWQKIINKKYFRDISYLVLYYDKSEEYKLDLDLLVNFFELADKIKRNMNGSQNRYDFYDLITDAYENIYKKIEKPEIFNDLLKLCISAGEYGCVNLLKEIINFNSENDIKIMKNHYDDIIKLGIIAGKNNSYIFFFNFINYYFGFLNGKDKDMIILGLEKLGPDFIYVLENKSNFINNIIDKFPDKFIDFCENIKKLADLTINNRVFYENSLDFIIDFLVKNNYNWNYLFKICEIFGENSSLFFSNGGKFLNKVLEYFPDNYEKILLKVKQIGEEIQGGNKKDFFTRGIKFSEYFLEKGKEKFIESLEQIKKINNEKLEQNNNTGSIFFKDGINYISKYIINSPDIKNGKWIKISEKIVKIINNINKSNPDNSNDIFSKFMLSFNNYIDDKFIENDKILLDNLLSFLEKICGNKDDLKVISSLTLLRKVENLGKNTVKKYPNFIFLALNYLLKNDQSKIIDFIKNLNLINDFDLDIDLDIIFNGEINNQSFKKFQDIIKTKLKLNMDFKNIQQNAIYVEEISKIFGKKIDDKINRLKIYSKKEREKNILNINFKQKKELKKYDLDISKYDENHRTLVLYFRDENMNSFHFSLITHILYKYIFYGHSKVFDKILITSRLDGKYPKEIHKLGNISYKYDDFKNITNIFANTIHFTHGSVIEKEFMKTTIHIIGIANIADYKDEKRVPIDGKYIPLFLKYGESRGIYTEELTMLDKSGDFDSLFDEIIKAVKSCEEAMLKSNT